MMLAFAISALIAYLISLGLIIPSLLRKSRAPRNLVIIAACIAIVCHAIALQQRIFDVISGQNLSLLNMASSASLFIVIVMTIVASRNRGWILLPIVYGFAIINLALSSFMPWEFITHLEATPSLLAHIVLALFSYSTLIIAALYAIQMAWIDYQLKHKRLRFSQDMPPLMSIERKMFHITQIGIVLLTLTLLTGFIYMEDMFGQENLHKTLLSIIAWFVYVILLWGRYQDGWRGRKVVCFNLVGASLLTLAYFGSRLIQALINY